jgi:hypothetical protein
MQTGSHHTAIYCSYPALTRDFRGSYEYCTESESIGRYAANQVWPGSADSSSKPCNMWWEVQTRKFHIKQFSQVSY